MKLTDKFSMQGHLEIYKVFSDGTRLLAFQEKNLITLATRQQVLATIYTFPATLADPIRWLKVGTGGTVDPEGLFPKEENETWSDLNTPVTTIGNGGLLTLSPAYTASVPQITFLVDLDQGTGNGLLITEAGLFKDSGGMFSVKTFPGIPKTSEFSLHFSWTIKFP